MNENHRTEQGGIAGSERITARDKKISYMLMTFLVTAWGFDYVVSKNMLVVFKPMTLLFLKYCIGFILILMIKFKIDGKTLVRAKDIPMFILCSLTGEILYFFCEYTAMDYMPVSLITIILSFVPAVSMIIERIAFHKKATTKMVVGVLVCIAGVGLVIGVDFKILMQGRIVGYLLAFGAVFSWNAYNYLTASLHQRYTSATLTCTQLICTTLLTLPYALHNMPEFKVFTPTVIGGIIYLGVVNAGIGFLIMVRSLHVLGPTTSALFSNFLPVTATFFGWIFLKESISVLQMIGGAVVIWAGCLVIKEKGKFEDYSNE